MNLIWKPIDTWPREQTVGRESSPFMRPGKYVEKVGGKKDWVPGTEVPWQQTLNELETELWAIGVETAVVQLALRERDIRVDGQMRADARPHHPGVILSFTHKQQGPLSFACDRWVNWKTNFRGIVKALNALRLVDRYGITSTGEQYSGWKEIGSGTPMGPGGATEEKMSRVDAARILAAAVSREHDLAANTTLVLEDDDFRRYAWKAAVKLAHPDTGAEVSDGFLRIQRAKDLLDSE